MHALVVVGRLFSRRAPLCARCRQPQVRPGHQRQKGGRG